MTVRCAGRTALLAAALVLAAVAARAQNGPATPPQTQAAPPQPQNIALPTRSASEGGAASDRQEGPKPPVAVMEGVMTGSQKGMAALHAWLGPRVEPREVSRRAIELIRIIQSHAADMTAAEMLAALNRIMDMVHATLAEYAKAAGGNDPPDFVVSLETAVQNAAVEALQAAGAIAALQNIAPAAGPQQARQAVVPLDLPPPVFANTDQASPS